MSKKALQLGMNPSTASARLLKDILFKMVEDTSRNRCFQCGGGLDRETFSIEHKVPWLDSKDPAGLYFDLENIAFSHRACNSRASRRPWQHSSKESLREARRASDRKRRAGEHRQKYMRKWREENR